MLNNKVLVNAICFAIMLTLIAGAGLSCIKVTYPSSTGAGSPTASAPSIELAPPPPPAVQGTITTGTSVDVDSKTIPSSGGTIMVSKPGDPLDGFVVAVPDGSYPDSRKFDISHAPVTGHTFGDFFKPITPLINIDNGGGYSDELITLKIPIELKQGYFAMPFLFDSSRGEIQGMPIVKEEQGFITVATRHFTGVVVTEVDFNDPKLKDTLWETGFLPGQDDWEFPNARSFATPDGLCNGMSLSAMWYYVRKPDGNKRLSFAYDNNGNSPPTPDFWMDDSLAYRYASIIMDDFFWDYYEKKFFGNIENVDDRTTWRSIVSAIINTKEPQLVAVRDPNELYGHALVVYAAAITGSDEGFLQVSDPNIFGALDRVITYSGGKFQPYNTALATGDPGIMLHKVLFVGKDTLVDFVDCESRWVEFKNKTIGSNPSSGHPQFPQYTLMYTNSKKEKKEAGDGFNTNDKLFIITAEKTSETLGTKVYRDGVQIQSNKDKFYELQPGKNRIGVYIAGKVSSGQFYYVDFKYLDINLCELALDPTEMEGDINVEYSFNATVSGDRTSSQLDWYINGKNVQSGTKTSIRPTFKKAGDYTIKVSLMEDGKEICSATCLAKIEGEDKTQTPTTQASSPGGSTSGTFPGEPFNGMQVTYTISGASITKEEDSEGFTWSRNITGKLASSGSLTVSGSAKMGNGYGADLVVTVTVDGQSKDYKSYIKSGFPDFNTDSFNISVPIPKNAKSGSVSIIMTGHYNAGERWVEVHGNF